MATAAIGPLTYNVPGPAVACPLGGCFWLGADDQVVAEDADPMRIDHTMVYYAVPRGQSAATLDLARDRLAAAGWRIDPTQRVEGYPGLTAYTDRLRVDVVVDGSLTGVGGHAPNMSIYLSKRVSDATVTAVVGAGLGGLLAGWLLGAWALHRFQRHRRRRRELIHAAAVPFFVIASLILLATATFVEIDFADGIDEADVQAPLAFGALGWPAIAMAAFAFLLGLAILVSTALPGAPPDPAAGNSAHPARPTPA